MGAHLAKLAAGPWWAHIPPGPRVLLIHMALSCYDRPTDGIPAGKYFRAREEMVLAVAGIGGDDPRWENAERVIRKQLTMLIGAGAIEQITPGRRGTRAEYMVRVDPLQHLQDELPDDPNTPVDNLIHLPVRGTPRSGTGGPQGPPNSAVRGT